MISFTLEKPYAFFSQEFSHQGFDAFLKWSSCMDKKAILVGYKRTNGMF
jgi:hypothetical protein